MGHDFYSERTGGCSLTALLDVQPFSMLLSASVHILHLLSISLSNPRGSWDI